MVLNEGLSVNHMFADGTFPLHVAAERGDLEMTKFLLSMRASPDLKTRHGQTPLMLGISYIDIVRQLINYGCKVLYFVLILEVNNFIYNKITLIKLSSIYKILCSRDFLMWTGILMSCHLVLNFVFASVVLYLLTGVIKSEASNNSWSFVFFFLNKLKYQQWNKACKTSHNLVCRWTWQMTREGQPYT